VQDIVEHGLTQVIGFGNSLPSKRCCAKPAASLDLPMNFGATEQMGLFSNFVYGHDSQCVIDSRVGA